jgi:catechol 2,3-dioxygenase-like lactoylglutathione lyase family enzyme
MRLKFLSLLVDDQDKALAFYTGTLGFSVCADIPMGNGYRWLTVTAPDGIEGVEMALELASFPPSRVYQQARFEAGMPAVAVTTTDVAADTARLKASGVRFRTELMDAGPIVLSVFEDGCGNLVNLVQPK